MDNLFWDRFYGMCLLKNTKPNAIAKEIGISSGIITKWKTAGTIPNGETLIKISDYLNCSVDYLLGKTDQKEKPVEINGFKLTPKQAELYEGIIKLPPDKMQEMMDYIKFLNSQTHKDD